MNRVADSGGAEVSTVQVIRALQGQGINFGVATLFDSHTTRFRYALEHEGTEFFSCDANTWLGRARLFRRAVQRFHPDLIHSTLPESDLLARSIARVERVPQISSLVNPSYSEVARRANRNDWRLDIWRLVDSWTARHLSRAFHALTQTVADEAVRALRIDPKRVIVVPRGRDRALLGKRSPGRRSLVRAQLGLAEGRPMLLNVARQVPQKGQVHLISAFANVRRRHPDALLLIAGRTGSATLDVEHAVGDHGLADSIRLLGVRDDVGDLLCAADVFAFSSLYEGFGGALVEAMAMGTPIVAFDVPAVREVVGEAGRLVPAADSIAMADAICDLLDDEQTREGLARNGIARYERRFTIQAVADAMLAMYRGVSSVSEGSRRLIRGP